MVKVIIGKKGTGKTKRLIEMVNTAAEKDNGNVVCIEVGDKLKFDISHKVRLIDINHYNISTSKALEGFVSGLFAGNYDITSVFIDSIQKIIGDNLDELGALLGDIDALTSELGATFVVMVSADADGAPQSVLKYVD